MRTLNRPMFRYGGPIKEGVMHGIREPKRNGGSMSQLVQPSSTGVRPGYKGPKSFLMSKVPFLANTYNKGLANLKKIPGFFSGKMNKTVPKVIRDSRGRAIGEGGEAVPTYLGRDPTVKLIGGTYKIVTDPRAKGYGKKAVQYGTSPSALLAGATFTDVLPGGNPFIGDRNILGQKFDKKTGIKTEGLFGRDLPAKAELEKIETDRIAKAERDEQARLEALFKTQNPDKDTTPKISADEARQNRIQKYRDIMDIKGMNKDAAYNSLIAASQAVSEEGDFKGSIKDGSLINKIIQSTSKQFDKPKATKDAIDSLILKSQIQKDMNKDKDALDREYKQTAIDINKQKLDSSFQDNKLLAANAKLSGQAAFDAAAGKSSENFRGNIVPNSEWVEIKADIKKKGGGMDDITIIANWTNQTIKGKQVPNGDYTVGDALVTIEEGRVTNITR